MATNDPNIGGGIATGAASFLKWLIGQNANSDATSQGYAALDKAQGAIQGAADKAIALQQPYLQNAGADYARQRGLVQSGYFQTPYGQSFHPQQYQPSGFTMNPSQGMASFSRQPFQTNSFTPQGLPPMPNLPAYQPPAQQQPPNTQMAPNPTDIVAMVNKIINRDTGPITPLSTGSPTPMYNPQTGQNTPLPYKPADPRMPTLQDLITLLKNHPQGQSGPYGMQGPTMQGRSF